MSVGSPLVHHINNRIMRSNVCLERLQKGSMLCAARQSPCITMLRLNPVSWLVPLREPRPVVVVVYLAGVLSAIHAPAVGSSHGAALSRPVISRALLLESTVRRLLHSVASSLVSAHLRVASAVALREQNNGC